MQPFRLLYHLLLLNIFASAAPVSDNPPTSAIISKRDPFGLYMCKDAHWGGSCIHTIWPNPHWHKCWVPDKKDFGNNAWPDDWNHYQSWGPDWGFTVEFYGNSKCSGDPLGHLTTPGDETGHSATIIQNAKALIFRACKDADDGSQVVGPGTLKELKCQDMTGNPG